MMRVLTLLLFLPVALLPAGASAQVTLDTLWPNHDGLRWEYEETFYASFQSPDSTQAAVALHLNGTTTVPGDREVQNLVEELPPGSGASPGIAAGDPLLRTLWRVRPDLRPKLETQGVLPSGVIIPGWESVLLHGGAWEETADEIRAWRTDVPGIKSWLFLAGEPAVSISFELQLVPDLANNVYLTGTYTSVEDVSVPAGDFERAYRVDYDLDYGQGACTNEGSPDALGTFNAHTRGFVYYVPGVGPVRSMETLTYSDVTGDCPGVVPDAVISRVRLELTSPVPAVPVTWGQLKARY